MTNLEKLYCYRGEDGDLEPKKMECLTEFGYPNLCVDEDGKEETMFVNTHFKTEREAWKSIIDSARAGVTLDGRAVANAKNELAKKIEDAAVSAERYFLISSNKKNPFKDEM